MLLLFDLEELNSVFMEYIVRLSSKEKIYVASKDMYLYFRYTLKVNVDMVSIRDNHIYTCEGTVNDTLPVYSQSLDKQLRTYGVNCNASAFMRLHTYSDELGG